MPIPKHYELFNPVLQGLNELGGSGTIAELDEMVMRHLQLTPEDMGQLHTGGPKTEVSYRLAWARTYLKFYGLIDNSQRGVWSLTPKGRATGTVDPQEVNRFGRKRSFDKVREAGTTERAGSDEVDEPQTWRNELLHTLKNLSPAAFERLSQRILRESGFTQVNVTGQSGDGGIDGIGILQFGGFVSFRVLFQCKRYKDTVGSAPIRDFRGAMVGRADRGLFITTGAFTQDARTEATRDGAPLIDLVDGDMLLDKLKELRLGVHVETRTVEDETVVHSFFDEI